MFPDNAAGYGENVCKARQFLGYPEVGSMSTRRVRLAATLADKNNTPNDSQRNTALYGGRRLSG
jgi:hypothetical protein